MAFVVAVLSVNFGWWVSRLVARLIDASREWDPPSREMGMLTILSPILAFGLLIGFSWEEEHGFLPFLFVNASIFGSIGLALYFYNRFHRSPLEPIDLVIMFIGTRIGLMFFAMLAEGDPTRLS